MSKTFGSTASASALGRRQVAGEGVAEEEALPISSPSKQTLVKVSRASLAVRGDCVVELGWAVPAPSVLVGHTSGGVATTASEELAAGRGGTPRVPAWSSWCSCLVAEPDHSAHLWPFSLPWPSALCAADHRSLSPSPQLLQPLHPPNQPSRLWLSFPDPLWLLFHQLFLLLRGIVVNEAYLMHTNVLLLPAPL